MTEFTTLSAGRPNTCMAVIITYKHTAQHAAQAQATLSETETGAIEKFVNYIFLTKTPSWPSTVPNDAMQVHRWLDILQFTKDGPDVDTIAAYKHKASAYPQEAA